jgi:hypothetical protein
MESKGIKDIVQVTLENGYVIRCTPDHKFLVKFENDNLQYKEIQHINLENDTVLNVTNNNISYIKVLSIIPAGQEEVFDIGVANHHNFIADGIVVHNCIPSRMTIGQLLESVVAKSAALQGHTVETTQFERVDANEIGDILESHGFERHGLETMYCGFTGKKMEAQIFICPTYYLRLKHLVQDKIHCLDEKHDVLTLDGWKPIAEVTIQDKVATLENNKLVYTKPTAVLHYPDYEGNMYRIKNQEIDLAVTGNHRMYVSKDNNTYDFEFAENLVGQHVSYKKDAEWDVPDYVFDSLNNIDSWFKFISKCVTKILEPEKIYNYIRHKELYTNIMSLNINTPDVFLPEWVFKLSKTQVQILIDELIPNNELHTIDTVLVDNIQQLCLHAGWSSQVEKCLNNSYKLNIIKNNINPFVNEPEGVQEEKFYYEKCPVYCLQVPSEIFYVRRNGKAVWTGNSRARGPVTLLTRQPPEGRSRDGGLRFGEMERDVLIAHGIPLFLKEKFMDSSDGFSMYVCGDCGLIARKLQKKNVYICDACKTSDTHKVQLPYAFKLMMQELMSVNILPRIRIEENEFNNSV